MESVSTRRRRIVMAAQKHRQEPMTTLNHHMDLNWMCEAYRCVRKDAAPGIDGQTVVVESVQPACKGRSFMVPFADDFVMGFERLEDARKVQRVLPKRFARFGLKINEEKTRLVRFGRPPPGGDGGSGGKPETFDFLGFTHYWGKSRRGNNVVKTKTAGKRFRRTLRSIKEWGWKHRHLPLKDQQRKLNEKLRGHDAYYGVTGNFRMLAKLRCEVAKLWRKWLWRRNRGRPPSWEQFDGMLRVFPLTPARIVHSAM